MSAPRAAIAALCLLLALSAGAETLPKGMGKFIMVVRSPADDRTPGAAARTYREPDVARYGGTLLRASGTWRIIHLPLAAVARLRSDENVSALQRVWTGESFDGWTEGEDDAIRTDAVDTGLTWGPKTYAYDASGNIRAVGTDTFAYDGLERLSTATVGGQTQTFRYDAFGNLTSIATTGQPATVIDVDPQSNRVANATYDVAGNFVSGPEKTIFGAETFYSSDATGMVVGVANGFVDKRMLYTADDERIGVISDEASILWMFRDFSGRPLRQFRQQSVHDPWLWEEDWIYAGPDLVGGERGGQRTPTNGSRVHYHRDHLGSVRVITNDARTAIGVHDYYPFGLEQTVSIQEELNFQARTPPLPEPLKFTGHERDFNGPTNVENTDYVDYMHARYYDPKMGRFLSVDPGGMDPRDPQTWNRYSYAGNNPLRYTDPDGRNFLDYLTGVANGYSSSLLYNINRVNAPNADFAVGQAVGDGIALVQSVYETVQGTSIAGGSGLVTALSGGTASPVSVPAAAGGVAMATHGATSTPVALSNLQSQMSKVRGLEKQVKAHEQKLADYKKDPDAHDNNGFLKNKTPEQRQNIIESRIRSLQHQIDTFKKKIEALISSEPK